MILALPHLGGWEWAGRWLADAGRHGDRGRRADRAAGAVRVVRRAAPTSGWASSPLGPDAGRVLRTLRQRRIVCLLCDRDSAGNGVEVEFFGERTTFPAGPATLALRAGAPVAARGACTSRRRQRPPRYRCARPSARARRVSCARTWPAAPKTSPTSSSAYPPGPLPVAPEEPNWPSDPGYGEEPPRTWIPR